MSYRHFWRMVLRSLAGQAFTFPLKEYHWGVLAELEGERPVLFDRLTEDTAMEVALKGNLYDERSYTVLRRPVGAWEKV